jgi:hypothetical protein
LVRFDSPSVDYVLIFLMILPNLAWILIDRSLWISDAALYGLWALKVQYALVHGDIGWWTEMLSISPKPPILPWLGQFFVPVGRALGSIDAGLLLVPFLAQVLTLFAAYRTHMEYFQRRSVALTGCLAIASAPLFIDVSRQFYVQSLQLAFVSWFVYIMAKVRTWDAGFIGLHLMAATACAMLVIVSSPVFVVVPVAVSVGQMWKNRMARPTWSPSHTAMLILALSLVFAAGSWYMRNAVEALAYADWAFQYRYSGVPDGFLTKLSIWTRLMFGGFGLPALFMMTALPVVCGGIALHWRLEAAPHAPAPWLILAIFAQVTFVLVVLSSSSQQTNRYLLPLAPYVALVVGWLMFQMRGRGGRLAIAGILLFQLGSIQVREFGAREREQDRDPASAAGLPIQGGRAREVLDAIINVTSGNPTGPVVLATGLLGLFSPQLEYQAAKRSAHLERYFSGELRRSDSVEFMLSGSSADAQGGRDLEQVWTDIQAKAAFVVVLRRQTREAILERVRSRAGRGDDGWLRILEGASDLAGRVEASDVFEPIDLPEFPEIVSFARTRGEHVR